MTFNRDQDSRAVPNLIQQLLADSETRVLPVFQSKFPTLAGALKLFEVTEFDAATEFAYLGRLGVEENPVLLVELEEELSITNNLEWLGLRQMGELDQSHSLLLRQAAALANWNRTHRFCPECGSETEVLNAGWVRRCLRDGKELFPRTDPAIIVAVTDDQDRLVLGSQAAWESNRFSVLAGYVDPGESLEAAVAREVLEEASLEVTDVKYWSSQAWPYPYSLMVGFTAKTSGVGKPDGVEIRELRWFTREDLTAARETVILPPRGSIARALIEDWFGREL